MYRMTAADATGPGPPHTAHDAHRRFVRALPLKTPDRPHYFRSLLSDGGQQDDELERRLAEAPVINVPTITLEGDANGAPHPDPGSYAGRFSGPRRPQRASGRA